MKKILILIIFICKFFSARSQENNMILFPIYGITPSITTVKDISKIKCEHWKNKSFKIEGINFTDLDGDKIIESLNLSKLDSMPKLWKDKYGFDWSLSYSEWKDLFAKYNYHTYIEKEPFIAVFDNRNTLYALLHAKSPSGKTKLVLTFEFGNSKNEGYTITSKNSLYSIVIETYESESTNNDNENSSKTQNKQDPQNVKKNLNIKYFSNCFHDFNGGWYTVTLDGKEGACDLTGKEVIPCKYDNVVLHSGYYNVKLDGKEGVCDLTGKEVIPCKYDNVVLQSGYYNVKLDSKEGACDLSGKEVIPCKYDNVGLQSGYYNVILNGKEGVCDLTGKEVIPCKYDNVIKSGGFYHVKQNGKEGACDLEGKEVLPCMFNSIYLSKDQYFANINGSYIKYDLDGNSLTTPTPNIITTVDTQLELNDNKSEKLNNLSNALNDLSNALKAASNNINSQSNTYNGYSNKSTNNNFNTPQLKRKSCSNCDGTGYIDTYVATFGDTSQKWCSKCNKMMSAGHCHGCKVCPVCRGKKYTESY